MPPKRWSTVPVRGPDGHYPVDPIVALLRDLRVKRGLKRQAVAMRIGCSPSYLLRLERGEYQPKLSVLRAWCLVLNVELGARLARDPFTAPAS